MDLSPVQPVLAAVAADVAIVGEGRARLATGEEFATGGASGPVGGLTEALYGRHYCRPQAPSNSESEDPATFLEALRAANGVPARFETWTVAGTDAGGLTVVSPLGAQRRVGYHEATPGPGGLTPGQAIRIAVARETVTASHFAVFGRAIADAASGRQVRFYWNLAPAGAAPFIGAVTQSFERRRIPFHAKVPIAPLGYRRADGGVLYLDAEDVEAALDLVAAVRQEVAAFLRPETPLFARPLVPGVAFAESPPGRESFGINRCRLLAEGLVQGFMAGKPAEVAMLERLLAYGIAPEAPERNPATAYPYRFGAWVG